MIEIEIQKHHIDKAKAMADDMGILNNSIMNGKGNIYGFLGEIILSEILNLKQCNTYDYDLVTPNGKTVDVKTKKTKMKPLPYYECSIAAYNTTQSCDYYAFCRIDNSMNYLWFLGIIDKTLYFNKARFLKKGQQDGDNGFIVRADCYNLSIEYIWNETKKQLGIS